jgi:hypothetical protein
MDAGEDEFSEASGNLFRWLKTTELTRARQEPYPGDSSE